MKRIVIGTAGHVDHGKTSLIKALTGTDCDRLKEEKERGLTIELGFASLVLPSGEKIGVVDVPGHVKFIRHMLSGASGIDLVLLIVAADEGVMPQTVEHIQICELLGIERGIVALTKIDMVDEDLLDLAVSDVKTFLDGTFLRDTPIIPVSSVTGSGLDRLLMAIEKEVLEARERNTSGIAFLPIDRVFTIKGFGTVVTGTLAKGTFEGGQDVEILPSGIRAKIRSIQIHSENVETAAAGMRTAINLQGIDREEIARGQWLVPSGLFRPTQVIDAELRLIKQPGKGGIRLYTGTAEVDGNINLYTSGEKTLARIRLKEPIIASIGNRFIIRSISPGTTLGGGRVINPYPSRRFSIETATELMSDNLSRVILGLVMDSGLTGISKKTVQAHLADNSQSVEKALQELQTKNEIVRFDSQNDLYVSSRHIDVLKNLISSTATAYHEANPSSPGISKEHLKSSIKTKANPKLFHRALTDMLKNRIIIEDGPNIRMIDFNASLGNDKDVTRNIYMLLNSSGLEPPSPLLISEKLDIDMKKLTGILSFMVREGRLFRIKDDIFLTDENEKILKEKIREFFRNNSTMNPADMKTITGVSRKYAIPYMEYLDRIRITLRVGDMRKPYPTP
ncbi:MAG TPA: selenocysteine-specific translation elongation factor [Desulfomonilia bacterium]